MDLKRVLFVYNAEKAGAEDAARTGASWCRKRDIQAQITSRQRFSAEAVDLVVAIGGDGTLLRVATVLYPREIPILGVHMGSLGFLAACEASAIEQALEKLLSGREHVEARLRLELMGTGATALNDVAVLGTPDSRFTEIEVWSEDELVMGFAGDGVLIATPTGASAYALACGGPVVHPHAECLLIAPVAPHRLDIRPVVLPAKSEVRVRARYPAEVWMDGDRVMRLQGGEEVGVKPAPAPTLLVRLPDEQPFFSRLRRKLGGSGKEGF